MNLRQNSKLDYYTNFPSRLDALRTGAFLRIADATEKMALNYDTLIRERDQYKKWYAERGETSSTSRGTEEEGTMIWYVSKDFDGLYRVLNEDGVPIGKLYRVNRIWTYEANNRTMRKLHYGLQKSLKSINMNVKWMEQIFDPPHFAHNGLNSIMGTLYGSLRSSWREDLRAAFKECFRVLKKIRCESPKHEHEWVRFSKHGKLPPERRYVLVQTEERDCGSPAVAVGWLRIHSEGPFFVVPGIGGNVTHYCDCLGDDFQKFRF